MTEDWLKLAREAKRGDGMGRLLLFLTERLRPLAQQVASQCVDDAVQAALVKIWRNIDRIDLRRSTTVRAWVMQVAVRAMRDEARKFIRHSKREQMSPVEVARPLSGRDGKTIDFGDYLELYLEHINRTGSFEGAHRAASARLGVSLAFASARFHREAERIIAEYGLRVRDDMSEFFK